MELSDEQRELYTKHIDKILAKSDPESVSVSAVRNGLQDAVDEDISDYKAAIKVLIKERFDVVTENIETPLPEPTPTKKHKVKHEDGEDADAKLAKKLQAEENANGRTARTTRNAGTKKTAKPKAAPKTKRNSTKKVDDDVDSSGEPVAKKRKANGAFNKPWNLSEPLAALVHEAQLSRPQTVKKIWEHIKAHNLQDPNDKRTIICDEVMLRVFGQKSVHMFTMNKLLSDHFYPLEPGQEAVVKDEAASNGMSEEVVKSEDEDEKVKSESDEE